MSNNNKSETYFKNSISASPVERVLSENEIASTCRVKACKVKVAMKLLLAFMETNLFFKRSLELPIKGVGTLKVNNCQYEMNFEEEFFHIVGKLAQINDRRITIKTAALKLESKMDCTDNSPVDQSQIKEEDEAEILKLQKAHYLMADVSKLQTLNNRKRKLRIQLEDKMHVSENSYEVASKSLNLNLKSAQELKNKMDCTDNSQEDAAQTHLGEENIIEVQKDHYSMKLGENLLTDSPKTQTEKSRRLARNMIMQLEKKIDSSVNSFNVASKSKNQSQSEMDIVESVQNLDLNIDGIELHQMLLQS